MFRKIILIIACTMCVGCSTLPQLPPDAPNSLTTTFALCRAADIITTKSILMAGGKELNPINKLLIKAAGGGMAGPIILSLLAIYWVWDHQQQMNQTEQATLLALSCLPPVINATGGF